MSAHRATPGGRSRPHSDRETTLATRTLSRRALRDQNDAAEAVPEEEEPRDDGDDGKSPAPKLKKVRARTSNGAAGKAPAKPRTRKKVAKAPERRCARWAVCDNGMKRVAVFDYKDRDADAKLVQTRESRSGTFFLLLVKDPYDPPAEPTAPA
jgi:hypothetical protein